MKKMPKNMPKKHMMSKEDMEKMVGGKKMPMKMPKKMPR